MLEMALSVLWFLIGLIVLAGIVYLAIWVIENFVHPIPEKVKQGIWVVVLLLALIAVITILAGGGGSLRPFWRHQMRFDAKIALTAFVLALIVVVILSFLGWERWSDIPPPS